jgi:hypothetical protein
MTTESPSRREFIKWMVSSFVLAPALSAVKVPGMSAWSILPVEQQSKELFSSQVPRDARLVASAKNAGVFAAVFETELPGLGLPTVSRWLCIAPERASGTYSIQVSNQALATSSSFHPVDLALDILDDGSVEVSEQHLRAHDRHVWKELDGKWCLAKKTFAGNVAHRFVTEEYDLAKEQFVATEGLIESDEPYARRCASTDVLVEVGTYCRGQIIT